MRSILMVTAAASALLLAGSAAAETTGVTGGGAPINNYQPSIVLSQTVQLEGVYPHQPGSGSADT